MGGHFASVWVYALAIGLVFCVFLVSFYFRFSVFAGAIFSGLHFLMHCLKGINVIVVCHAQVYANTPG